MRTVCAETSRRGHAGHCDLPKQCTMWMRSQLQFGADLPNYPGAGFRRHCELTRRKSLACCRRVDEEKSERSLGPQATPPGSSCPSRKRPASKAAPAAPGRNAPTGPAPTWCAPKPLQSIEKMQQTTCFVAHGASVRGATPPRRRSRADVFTMAFWKRRWQSAFRQRAGASSSPAHTRTGPQGPPTRRGARLRVDV